MKSFEIKKAVRDKIEGLVRTHHNGNASAFAKRIGVRPGNVSRWLCKTDLVIPAADTCWRIANAYGISLDWFLSPMPAVEVKRTDHCDPDLVVTMPFFEAAKLLSGETEDIIQLTRSVIPSADGKLFALRSPITSQREGIRLNDLLVCGENRKEIIVGDSVLAIYESIALKQPPKNKRSKFIVGVYAHKQDLMSAVIDDEYSEVDWWCRNYLAVYRIHTVIRTSRGRPGSATEFVKLKPVKDNGPDDDNGPDEDDLA